LRTAIVLEPLIGNLPAALRVVHHMRCHPLRVGALLIMFALAAGACAGDGSDAGDAGAETTEQVGTDGIELALAAPVLGDGELATGVLEGQDTVLWFWAPWCTTCRGEAPDVVAVADAFAGQVEIVGVAGRGEVPDMEDFVSETGTGGLTHLVDADGEIWSSFEVVAQPAFAFIDQSGEVEVVVGALGEQGLTERLDALVAA